MADRLTAEQRSACMRAIRSKDTSPEMRVRRLTHSLGYRYALHVTTLPGKPDLVFASRRKVIFVHGCFWHNHTCRHGTRAPATNVDYWNAKRERNSQRDKLHLRALRKEAWEVLVLWECQLKNLELLQRKLIRFLGPRTGAPASATGLQQNSPA